jgi:hypothetical protein
VDCIDKKCYLVHQLRQVCVIPLPTNNSLCDIPCLTSGCDHETHRSIVCPIWLCKPVRTTTTPLATTTTPLTTSTATTTTTRSTTTYSTTTTTTTSSFSTTSSAHISTIAPMPMPISCHSILLYSSISFNILLLVAFITLLVRYLKVLREDRNFEEEIQRRLHPIVRVDRFRGQVGLFSLGSSIESLENLLREDENERRNERTPLIQTSSAQNIPGSQLQGTSNQQQGISNESFFSDNTFIRNRNEHISMKTFKPEAEKSKRPQIDESTV